VELNAQWNICPPGYSVANGKIIVMKDHDVVVMQRGRPSLWRTLYQLLFVCVINLKRKNTPSSTKSHHTQRMTVLLLHDLQTKLVKIKKINNLTSFNIIHLLVS
jgi:hypothetical protein